MSTVGQARDNLGKQLARAFAKLRWGKRYSTASEIADKVRVIRSFFMMDKKRNDKVARTLAKDLRVAKAWLDSGCLQKLPPPRRGQSKFLRQIMFSTAGLLFHIAVTNQKELRRIAAILAADELKDPRQENLLSVYIRCLKKGSPTLSVLKKEYIGRHGEKSWTGDFNARKTISVLGLVLSKDKVGRPAGSRSN